MEHQSTPGREVPYIIRNSAIKNKPIMGIGCLASPVLQHGLRDDWIGWSVEAAQQNIISGKMSPFELLRKLKDVINFALLQIELGDLGISEEDFKNPRMENINKLDMIAHRAEIDRSESIKSGSKQEVTRDHQRLRTSEYAAEQAQIGLFKKKRAEKVKRLLECRIFLNSVKSIKNEYLLRTELFFSAKTKSFIGFLLGDIRTLAVS